MATSTTSPDKRYVYSNGGSVTPTPKSKYSLIHGSSQTSLNSTNPFDDDDGDDNTSRISGVEGVKRPARKKRRAPPPPLRNDSVSRQQI